MKRSASNSTASIESVPNKIKRIPFTADMVDSCEQLEIVFSFDTTGSMFRVLNEVQRKLTDLIRRIFIDIPNIKIGIIAHGDYGDIYVTKIQDLTSDIDSLCQFVKSVGPTDGGDFEECYELVLKEVRTRFSWTPGTKRRLVMIGDAIPHEVEDARNELKIDWRTEVQRLVDEKYISIHSIQVYENDRSTPFWKRLAESTPNGSHLLLDNIQSIPSFILAICYHEVNSYHFSLYENELHRRLDEPVHLDTLRMLSVLRASDTTPQKITTMSSPKKKWMFSHYSSRTSINRKKSKLFSLGLSSSIFPGLKWTPWKLAFTGVTPRNSKQWHPYAGVGYQRDNIFREATKSDQLYQYELAVQAHSKSKRFVMSSQVVRSLFKSKDNDGIDLVLRHNVTITWQLQRFLVKGMRVFTRRRQLVFPQKSVTPSLRQHLRIE